MPVELFGEGARQGRYSQAMPMREDAGAVRGVSEEVRRAVDGSRFAQTKEEEEAPAADRQNSSMRSALPFPPPAEISPADRNS